MSEAERTEVEANAEDGAELEQAIDTTAEAVAVQTSALDELAAEGGVGRGVGLSGLMNVPVSVTVEVGRSRMALQELVALGVGSLLELDRREHEPADVLVNGKTVARGEIVTLNGSYGLRITELIES